MDRLPSLQLASSLGMAHGFPGANAKQPAHPKRSSHPCEDLNDYEPFGPVFKIIGVGGAGCNVVECMIREGVTGAEYICIDSDAQSLINSSAGTKFQVMPNPGSEGESSASSETVVVDRDRIHEALEGANLVFIIAGMGGSTGSNAAHVVAKIANEVGALTVAFVTQPLKSESKRICTAEQGIKSLSKHVDSLFVISNEKMKEIVGEQASMPEIFRYADTLLAMAVESIIVVSTEQSIPAVDYADIKTVLTPDITNEGVIGFAAATGIDRARRATESALRCPLLERANLSKSYCVLAIITCDHSFKMEECHEVLETVKKVAGQDDATFIIGVIYDEKMAGWLRVTLFSTGLGK